MTTAHYDESVQDAVARETKRRKQVFSAFISLLLVPIAIGAYALSKAPTETQKVADDVAPIVTQRVGADISAGITDKVIAQTQPIIQKNVAKEISAAVEPRLTAVATLRQDITNLKQTTQKVSDFVATATPQLGSISGLNERLSAVQGLVNQHDNAFKTISSEQASLRQSSQALSMSVARVAPMANDLELSRQQMQKFQQSVTNDLGSIKQMVNSDIQSANANKEAIGSLSNRLSRLETELKNLQGRASALERSKDERKPQ